MIDTWISQAKSKPEIAASETKREVEDLLWSPSELKPDKTSNARTADQAFLWFLIWTAVAILYLSLLVGRSAF